MTAWSGTPETIDGVDLDHTSFAVHDAAHWAPRLRRHLGAVPVAGETTAEFRDLLLYVGTAEARARIELLEAVGAGFLSRYLARHCEGTHHVTFTVPDLRVGHGAAVRGLGLSVVGESYQDPAWREAFVLPDAVHGTLVQLASSDRSYPCPTVLLGSPERVPEQYPSVAGATDPGWWTPVWDSPRGEPARLAATRMASTDLAASRRLFEGVLGARTRNADDGLRFSWASGGDLDVAYRDHPAVLGMALHRGPVGGVRIDSALLGSPTTPCRAEQAVPVAERHTP